MSTQISHEHHFVPQFLLRAWAINGKLRGLYQASNDTIRARELGARAFCKELDLLTINAHDLPADALEREFFGPVDARGALVTKRLLEDGPDSLRADERSDLGRLLLSRPVRREEPAGSVSAFCPGGAISKPGKVASSLAID